MLLCDPSGILYVRSYVTGYILNQVSMSKKTDKSARKLTKLGGKSIGLTLPIELVRELEWREKQRVVVKKVKGGFTVRDYRSKK